MALLTGTTHHLPWQLLQQRWPACRRSRHRGLTTDEAICFPVLRACFNALRALWTPSGYPPKAAGSQQRRPVGPAGA